MNEEKECDTHPDALHITKDRIEIDCPRCGGAWYTDLDESGTPYTCYHCCNGTHKCYKDEYENNGI